MDHSAVAVQQANARAARFGLADRARRELGVPVAVTDTVMVDDAVAEGIARTALELLR